MKDLSHSTLGQYDLAEVIGRGSTSVVYKAYQRSLARFVAVKVLLVHLNQHFAARFRGEAHAVAQLQHPNILPIYDYGEQRGLRYFVMQYIESRATLDDLLMGQPVDPITTLRLMLPLLSGLEYAHARGVVHRDIKPANIMLPRPDWPMLADFGIAKLIDSSEQLTPPGQRVGTAIYMAPERAGSGAVDVRSDLYSVGVVLYEMLTGQVPFNGVSPAEVLRKHVREPVPAARDINPLLPAPAEPVLLRALAKRPSDRYQTAAAMASDLQRLIGQLERLAAQQQLNALLQQPAQGAPAGQDPYETREFTTDPLPVIQRPIAPPAIKEPDLAGESHPAPPFYSAPPAARHTRGWVRGAIAGIGLLALVGAMLLARGAYGRDGTAVPTAALPATSAPVAVAAPSATIVPASPIPPAAPAAPSAVVALPDPSATPAPSAEPVLATPTPRPAPISAPPAPATTPIVSQIGYTVTIVLEDTDWQGGYRRPGRQTYGGRTATWIYGTGTKFSVMRARFTLPSMPTGTVALRIEGMDSEDEAKTPIQMVVNDVEIYNGPNPLPDDDKPLQTGTWASQSWEFDASLLHAGENEISVSNLAEGTFSRPPFFMLDYAELTYSIE